MAQKPPSWDQHPSMVGPVPPTPDSVKEAAAKNIRDWLASWGGDWPSGYATIARALDVWKEGGIACGE